MLRPPPTSTLFPYTTLFRSHRRKPAVRRRFKALKEIYLQKQHGQIRRELEHFQPPGLFIFHEADVRRCVIRIRSEEHTTELRSQSNLVCRLLLEKEKTKTII